MQIDYQSALIPETMSIKEFYSLTIKSIIKIVNKVATIAYFWAALKVIEIRKKKKDRRKKERRNKKERRKKEEIRKKKSTLTTTPYNILW